LDDGSDWGLDDIGIQQPSDYSAASFSTGSVSAGNASTNSPYSSYGTQAPKSTKAKKKRSNQNVEMDEKDTRLVSTGLLMTFAPLIATVLPLIGLQIKGLQSLGANAPLGAIVIGLIGAGCIGYGRRNFGDAPFSAIGSLVLAIGLGFGGHLLLAYEEGGADGGFASTAFASPSDPAGGTEYSPEQFAANEKKRLEQEKKNRDKAQSIFDEQKQNLQKQQEDISRQRSDRNQKTMSGFSNASLSGDAFPSMDKGDFGSTPFDPSSTSSGQGNRAGSNAASDSDGSFQNSSFEDLGGQSSFGMGPKLEQSTHEARAMLGQRSATSRHAFLRADLPNSGFARKYEFEATIGIKNFSGSLFPLEDGLAGICLYQRASGLSLIPILENEDDVEHVIRPKLGQKIVGLRLSFDEGIVQGAQGLFVDVKNLRWTEEDLVQGEWIGSETDNIQKSVCKKKIVGLATFGRGFSDTGMAWVVEK
jgi:hypothetical protein